MHEVQISTPSLRKLWNILVDAKDINAVLAAINLDDTTALEDNRLIIVHLPHCAHSNDAVPKTIRNAGNILRSCIKQICIVDSC